MRRWAVVLLVVGFTTSGMPVARGMTAQSPDAPPGCVATPAPDAAAAELLDPGASIVKIDWVAGLASALATVPIVVHGARHRLVQPSPHVWCDALAGFNAVASGETVSTASAFASVAAARYFDGVTVKDAELVAPGRVELETHALTNGVVAHWSVDVDAIGVRKASWKATRFAVEPFEAQPSGPTAYPGATMEYRRDATGLLSAASDPFAVAAAATSVADSPSFSSSIVEMSDGFKIVVSRGNAPYVYPEARTGLWNVDVLGVAARSTRENYEDFLGWGLRGGWVGVGNVFVDGGLGPYCGACVFVSRSFNIHISSAIQARLESVGFTYPDPELFFSLVIGHEMVHNFQVANGSVRFPLAFVEGVARFQETLHDYSRVTHQPASLTYAGGVGGCNGYVETIGAALSQHWYDACLFWMNLFVDHGPDVITKLIATDSNRVSLEKAVEAATGVPLEVSVSRLARRALTGEELVWGPIVGSGPELNWAEHLKRWSPPALTSVETTLGSGGAVAGRVTTDTKVDVSASAPTKFTVVRHSAAGTSTTDLISGETVAAPVDGEDVWVVAAAGASRSSVRIATAETAV